MSGRNRDWWPVAEESGCFFARADVEAARRPLSPGTRVKPGEVVRRGDMVAVDGGLATPMISAEERVRRWAEVWGWFRSPDETTRRAIGWAAPDSIMAFPVDVVLWRDGSEPTCIGELADPKKGWTLVGEVVDLAEPGGDRTVAALVEMGEGGPRVVACEAYDPRHGGGEGE